MYHGSPPMTSWASAADRLHGIEAEMSRLRGTSGSTVDWFPGCYPSQMPPHHEVQTPMPNPFPHQEENANSSVSAADFARLACAYQELANNHTNMLKLYSDMMASLSPQGSAAAAAASLRQNDANSLKQATTSNARGGNELTSNDEVGSAPKEATLMDNTLLFLPECACHELRIEPNMDDKGDPEKELWFGRVWELRSLLAAQSRKRLSSIHGKQSTLSYEARREFAVKLQDPFLKQRLIRMQARWKASALRARSSLRFLERLKFCNLRGTLVYAHGSGGCSWDNMRICRMISRLGILVIAPDGFAYPKNTAMGALRHKDCLPLHRSSDDVNYWTGDLIYSSKASGTSNYSTKADTVLENPKDFCDLYERCYQLRRSELHYTIRNLPQYVKTKGFFLGGTSEGGMAIARFDDQRYGEMICGRFINSFSIEYNYFTPTPDAGELGGQFDVPTLNIIGTNDQYFGPEDSVAKIVASDDKTGYGDKNMTGNGYKTMVRQGVEAGLVTVLEGGVHSPCNTHDNFLRELFDIFFARPGSIWEIDAIWAANPNMKDLLQVMESTIQGNTNVVRTFVPKPKRPNKWSLRKVQAIRNLSKSENAEVAEALMQEKQEQQAEEQRVKSMLDSVRANAHRMKPTAASQKKSYYDSDKCKTVHKLKRKSRP